MANAARVASPGIRPESTEGTLWGRAGAGMEEEALHHFVPPSSGPRGRLLLIFSS